MTVYRASTKVIGGLATLMAGSSALLLFRMSADDVGAGVLVWVGLGMAAFCGFLLAMVVRAVTVVSDEGVTVRQVFRTRHYPWATIADIQIAPMSGTGMQSAVIFDANLRRVFLPQVTDRMLGSELDDQIAELRRHWETARGPGWQPRTAEVAERVEAIRQRFWTPMRIGVTVGLTVGLTAAVLASVL